MALLMRVQVLPLYAQVSLSDALAEDFPVPVMGDEEVVASHQAVAVATRSDYPDGRLPVEVWTERLEADVPDLRCVFDGQLYLSDGRALVGNLVANDVHTISLSPGSHGLLVFTATSEDRAGAVYFLLDPAVGATGT